MAINIENIANHHKNREKNRTQKRKIEEEHRNLQEKRFKTRDRQEEAPKKTRTSQPENMFKKFVSMNTTWE